MYELGHIFFNIQFSIKLARKFLWLIGPLKKNYETVNCSFVVGTFFSVQFFFFFWIKKLAAAHRGQFGAARTGTLANKRPFGQLSIIVIIIVSRFHILNVLWFNSPPLFSDAIIHTGQVICSSHNATFNEQTTKKKSLMFIITNGKNHLVPVNKRRWLSSAHQKKPKTTSPKF